MPRKNKNILYNIVWVAILGDMNIEEITKTKGEIQMMKAATIGAVTHGNLINNKKININTLYLCIFLTEEIYSKYGVFFVPG